MTRKTSERLRDEFLAVLPARYGGEALDPVSHDLTKEELDWMIAAARLEGAEDGWLGRVHRTHVLDPVRHDPSLSEEEALYGRGWNAAVQSVSNVLASVASVSDVTKSAGDK